MKDKQKQVSHRFGRGSAPGRGRSKCKGPKVEMSSRCSRDRGKAREAKG